MTTPLLHSHPPFQTVKLQRKEVAAAREKQAEQNEKAYYPPTSLGKCPAFGARWNSPKSPNIYPFTARKAFTEMANSEATKRASQRKAPLVTYHSRNVA